MEGERSRSIGFAVHRPAAFPTLSMTTTTGKIPLDPRAPVARRDPSRLRAPAGTARRVLLLRRVAVTASTAAAVLAALGTVAGVLPTVLGRSSVASWLAVGVSAGGGLAWVGVALRGLARRGDRRDRALAWVVLVVTALAVLSAGPASHAGPMVTRLRHVVQDALGVPSLATGVPALLAVVVLLCAVGVAVLTIRVRWAEPVFATVLVLVTTSLYARAIGGGRVLLQGALRTVPPISAAAAGLLAIGGLAASQGRVARVFSSARVDGAIARRFGPIALLLPMVLGFLANTAARHGVVANEGGPLLFVVPSAMIGLALVVSASRRLERAASLAQEVELHRRDEARIRLSLRRRSVLEEVTADFSRALDPEDVVRVVAEHKMTALGLTRFALQWSGDEPGRVRVAGWDEHLLPPLGTLIDEAVGCGAAHYLPGRRGIVEVFPELCGGLPSDESWAVVPMVAFGQRTGALAVSVDGCIEFDDEQRSMLHDLARRCAEALDRARTHQSALDLAHRLGRGLVPSVAPHLGGLDLAGANKGSELDGTLGGDWYDAFGLEGDRVCVTIGDVEGRGLAAASVMGEVRTALRLAARSVETPAAMLSMVNRVLAEGPERRMVRATVAVLSADGKVSLAVAGMPPALRCSARRESGFESGGSVVDRVEEVPTATSLPLGVHASARFEDVTFTLDPDEALLLHTDGVVARRGESLGRGLARLRWHLEGAGSDPATLVARASELIGPDQEAAVLVVRAAPVDARLPMRMVIGRPEDLATVRRRFRRWLLAAGADTTTADDLVLGLNEAVANALDHGGADVDHPAVVEVQRIGAGWMMDVSDEGPWRSEFVHDGGRGMAIMSAMTEVEVLHHERGKTVRMRRAVPAGAGTERRADRRDRWITDDLTALMPSMSGEA